MMKGYCLLLFSFLFSNLFSQTNFYSPDTIQKIEITFSQPNWDLMMDTAKVGAEGYLTAVQVQVNGTAFDSVGVKYKGYSSFDSTKKKNPLHIKLDYVKPNANYKGHEDFKLSNGFSDPSSVREVLSYEILRNYMDAPQSNFAQVYINGTYYGVYSSSEDISRTFLSKKFYSSNNSFFKCNPASVVSGQIPNLLYLGPDSTFYYSRYEIKEGKWKDLVDLCDTLANQTVHVDSILDVDRALWMLAFNNVTVNLDSYSGAFAQNYYLYRDLNQRFVPIVWDLNMCLGGFPNTGSGTLNIAGMQNMTPLLHSSNGARPLIMNLLANPVYNKMYIAHMRTIDDEFFASGSYLTRAQALQGVIDTSVQSESFALYSYSQFQGGLTTNNGNIPGISNLMGSRSAYLNSTTQFQQVPPVISTPTTSPATINLGDTIWVSCKVSNQTSVMLGCRDQLPKRFRRVQMFDDGLHHDGIAGDSIFGAGMKAASSLMQYYIYAENANAGIFSPERAEHEFHTVAVVVPLPAVGDVVINEFLADNITDTTDEKGQHEDWIELFNNTGSPINLYGLYLSDDFSNPKKYSFPNPTTIPANGFLTLWADEDVSTAQFLHCNFNLSALGEQLMLGNGSAIILDSITFGVLSPDTSLGRCLDGTGPFIIQPATSFNGYNYCGDGVNEVFADSSLGIFPNPATDQISIVADNSIKINKLLIFNSLGEIVRCIYKPNLNEQLNISELPSGLYCIQLEQNGGAIHSARFIKQ